MDVTDPRALLWESDYHISPVNPDVQSRPSREIFALLAKQFGSVQFGPVRFDSSVPFDLWKIRTHVTLPLGYIYKPLAFVSRSSNLGGTVDCTSTVALRLAKTDVVPNGQPGDAMYAA